jgi:hypothetical protein
MAEPSRRRLSLKIETCKYKRDDGICVVCIDDPFSLPQLRSFIQIAALPNRPITNLLSGSRQAAAEQIPPLQTRSVRERVSWGEACDSYENGNQVASALRQGGTVTLPEDLTAARGVCVNDLQTFGRFLHRYPQLSTG